MNYPYGDYIFYTDNTPLFSVIVKLISSNIYDISNHAITIFTIFSLSGFVLSAILTYKILSEFSIEKFLIIIFSIALPWTNPQTLRIAVGHFNLAYSWIILVCILLLIKIYKKINTGQNPNKLLVLLAVFTILVSFIHVYFLAIVLVLSGTFFFTLFCYNYFKKLSIKEIGKAIILTVGVPLVSFVFITKSIDTYFDLRNESPSGYNWIEWKFNVSALYSSYSFLKNKFIIINLKNYNYESVAYLGTTILFFTLLIGLVLIFIKSERKELSKDITKTQNFYPLILLTVGALVSLSISMGPDYHFLNDEYRFINYLNPFFYLEKFTQKVKQFRALGRFSWIFFWIFNIWVLIIVSWFYRKYSYSKFIIIPLLLLVFVDVKDTCIYYKTTNQENFLNMRVDSEEKKNLKALFSAVDVTNYQAILPIPYYNVGTEDYNTIIDPEDVFCRNTYQASLLTNLPLMSGKLGRSPIPFVEDMFSLFEDKPVPQRMLEKFNSKPVLVLVKRSFFNGEQNNWPNPPSETSKNVFNNSIKFIEYKHCVKLNEVAGWELYQWNLNN
ncbi:MAG: hypothetical protein NVV82_22935 [Sporocytophaga sp.]|nr:hypothetical protein [Sporocytophaga sp.]